VLKVEWRRKKTTASAGAVTEASQQGRSARGARARARIVAFRRANAESFHIAQVRHVSQIHFPTKPDTRRSSEPILIPKLRIQFADFPYLQYSIDNRLFTLKTGCGYGYELARVLHVALSWIFKFRGDDPDSAATAVLFAFQTLSPCLWFPGISNAYTEKKTLPVCPDGISRSCWVIPTSTLAMRRI